MESVEISGTLLKKPTLSVVIPSFNSGNFLEKTCAEISDILGNYFDWEIIVVNDSSTDNTWAVIKTLHEKNYRIKGISLEKNTGQQAALFCGLLFCSSEWIVTIDDDLEHDPGLIPELYKKACEGYDLVYADIDRKSSFIRKAGTMVHDLLFYLLFKKPQGIKITSYRILSGKLAAKIIETDKKFIYISAIALLEKPRAAVIKPVNVKKMSVYSAEPAQAQALLFKSRYNIIKLTSLFLKLLINYSFLSGTGSGTKLPVREKIKKQISDKLF